MPYFLNLRLCSLYCYTNVILVSQHDEGFRTAKSGPSQVQIAFPHVSLGQVQLGLATKPRVPCICGLGLLGWVRLGYHG